MNLAHIFDHECPNILIFDEIDSTSSEIKRLFLSGYADPGLIVFADKQNSGYGKEERVWHSETGNIHFSFLLKSSLPLQDLVKTNFLISLALREMLIEKFFQQVDINDFQVKWPNDLLFQDKKFCGVLSESICDSFGGNYLICGIGINALSSPDFVENTTSLLESGLKIEDNLGFVIDFLYKFERIFLNWEASNNKNLLITELNKNLAFKGRQVILHYNNQEFLGVVKEVGVDGRLHFLSTNNEDLIVSSGEIYKFSPMKKENINVVHMKREE